MYALPAACDIPQTGLPQTLIAALSRTAAEPYYRNHRSIALLLSSHFLFHLNISCDYELSKVQKDSVSDLNCLFLTGKAVATVSFAGFGPTRYAPTGSTHSEKMERIISYY